MNRYRGSIGLDIDFGEVRAVELENNARTPGLKALGRSPLPPEAVGEGMILRPEMVADVLSNLWNRCSFSTRECFLGVANQGVLVRIARFPKVPEKNLDKMVRFKAQEYIPLPLSSVVLDYAVLGEVPGEANTSLDILLVAAKRDMLNSFIKTLKLAGLKPRDIDVSSLALQRVLPATTRKGAHLMADIGNGQSNILIICDGVPRFARHISFGLINAFDSLGYRLEKAVGCDGQTSPAWPETVLQEWAGNLSEEIISSVNYYQAQGGEQQIETVFISGRGARVRGLNELLHSAVELPVIGLQPFEGLVLPPGHIELSRNAPDYAVALALAWRGLGV